jgi:CheY-like chemotaxis protein
MSPSKKGDKERGSPPRVLVVEDEFVVSLALKAQVEAAGCEVVGTARDAESAVELAGRLRPDVVLMDIGLAGSDGVEATRAIMGSAPTRVILLTAYTDERVQRGLAAGACLVVTKPVVEEQLAHAIAEVTGRAPHRPFQPGRDRADGS